MKPHKWAKEIKAWADGAEIEHRWIDRKKNDDWDLIEPNHDWTLDCFEYRIKPHPKEELCKHGMPLGKCRLNERDCQKPQYLYITDGAMGVQFWRDKQYQENPGQWNIGKIKLEQDDE